MDNPILSICIPTNGMVKWVMPALECIYTQGVDNKLFEVVITDNGPTNNLADAISQYSYQNLHYYKTTSMGFTNQIDAFEKCTGIYCKMLNHRSKLLPGSIEALLNLINKNEKERPIIYCAEGHAQGGEFIHCKNTDEFVNALGYWVSWSAGVGAWKEDLKCIRGKKIDKMFPHTIFLFGLRKESKYLIWNGRYEKMEDDSGKGGYDVFQTFAVHFLDLIKELKVNNRISGETFESVRQRLYPFLTTLYQKEVLLPTKHTFIIKDIRKSMKVYYGEMGYWKMFLQEKLRVNYWRIKKK